MTRIVWSDQAQADLAAIHAYIARDSERHAQLTLEQIIGSVDRLIAWPRSGRTVPEIGDENLREVLVAPYRIVYRLERFYSQRLQQNRETLGSATR